MGILDEMLEGKKTIVILGHVNPDGDCIGSCLGLYNYLKENYEGLEISVYLEKMGVKFSYLSGYKDVHTEYDDTKTFDLCITSDASDVPRLGVFAPYRETAKDTFCVDHHITNKGMCRVNVIKRAGQAPQVRCCSAFSIRERSAKRSQSACTRGSPMTPVSSSSQTHRDRPWRSPDF